MAPRSSRASAPAKCFVDQAVEIRIDERTVWRPADVGAPSGLPMTVRDGLVQSKNTITAQVMQRVGPARVAKVAYDMGVRQSKLDAVPSLALGTSPVTLKEMVTAYGAIANNGSYIEPVLVTRIENRKHGSWPTSAPSRRNPACPPRRRRPCST